MKNYSINGVLGELGLAISVEGKVVHVEKQIGIGSWGKLDFLKRNGYSLVTKY